MTDHSISSTVEVDVDPPTAFTIFTEELGLWWMQGPINFYDTTKAIGKRMEPGVGGRLIEVYDAETGEGLELGRITSWEPGKCVAWTSSLDDVSTEVRFEEVGDRTKVVVEATIPAGGRDEGGTSWVRMTPVWFGDWCSKRDHVPHEPLQLSRLGVAVHYAEPAAAARWLHEHFDLEPSGNLPDDEPGDQPSWIEFHVGAAILMVFAREGDKAGAPTHVPWIFVDDVDDHYARSKAAGVTITQDLWQHGARAYEAEDLEGNRWTFAQVSPTIRG